MQRIMDVEGFVVVFHVDVRGVRLEREMWGISYPASWDTGGAVDSGCLS